MPYFSDPKQEIISAAKEAIEVLQEIHDDRMNNGSGWDVFGQLIRLRDAAESLEVQATPSQPEREALHLTPIETQATLDALEFTESRSGLVSDAHI